MAVVYDPAVLPTRADLARWRRDGPPFDRIECEACEEVIWTAEKGGDFEKAMKDHAGRCRRR